MTHVFPVPFQHTQVLLCNPKPRPDTQGILIPEPIGITNPVRWNIFSDISLFTDRSPVYFLKRWDATGAGT